MLALIAAVGILATPGPARGEGDYKFGMALIEELGYDDLALKFFNGLKNASSRQSQLAGTLGLGGIKKRLAEKAEQEKRPQEAKKLYDEAKKLIDGFVKDAPSDHPDRGDAIITLGKIEKRYIKTILDRIKQTTDEAEKRKLREEAKAIYEKLTKPLLEEAKRAKDFFEKLNAREKPPPKEVLARALDKAVQAMQMYFNMVLEQADIYEEASDERKKFIEKVIADLQKEKQFYDEREFHGVVLWIDYSMGRAYVLAGKIDKACKDGFDPVCEFDTNDDAVSAAAKEWADNLKFYAFYTRAKALFDAEKYDKTVDAVNDMGSPPYGFPWFLDHPLGNAALILKARALFLKEPPDYQGAIREANRVISKGLMPWPNNARRVLAEVQDALKIKQVKVVREPGMLHNSAIGAYHRALEARSPKKQRRYLERAVRGLNDTIAACREPDAKYRVRLEHEPSAWFQLGICYSKMKLWYEARFAFEAVLRYFAKDVVGRVLSEHPNYKDAFAEIERKVKAGEIKPAEEGQIVNTYALLFDEAAKGEGLKSLLEGVQARLKKSANNLVVAARRRHNESRSRFDAERLNEAIETLIRVDPEKKRFVEFHIGLLRRQEAVSLLKSRKWAADGVKKLEEAADLFIKSAEGQRSIRELAYHLAGKAYYQVMSEVEKPEMAKRYPKLAARTAEFGKKALEAFARFEKIAGPLARTGSPKDIATRGKRITEAQIARPVIHMSMGKFDEAVKAADRYLARKDKDKKFASTVTWTRFRAFREKALAGVGTSAEGEVLGDLVRATDELRADKQFYPGALSMLAGAYNEAAEKLKKMAENKPEAERAALDERAQGYRKEFAVYMKKLIKLRPSTDPGFLVFIAEEFYKQKVYDAARDLYRNEILDKFDPSGENKRITIAPDEFEAAAKKVQIESFETESKLRRVREQIKSLKEPVFGEPLKERYDEKYKDKLVHPSRKRDWHKAITAIGKILAENPKIQCKAELAKIKAELIFRLQLLRVKLNLADCNVALAKKLQAGEPEKARPLWEEVVALLDRKVGVYVETPRTVREYFWRDGELRFLQAEACENIGKYQEARDLYIEAKTKAQYESDSWFRAQVAFSRVVLRMGEVEKDKEIAEGHIRKAMGFPNSLLSTYTKETREKYWPDADKFVAKCEAAIKALGKDIIIGKFDVKIEDEDYTRTITPTDEDLHLQLRIIDVRIKNKEVEEATWKVHYKAAFERHLRGLPDRVLKQIRGQLAGEKIKKPEAQRLRKVALARYLYQSPLGDYKLQGMAVKLGVLETKKEGVPSPLLSDKAKQTAIKLGLLTKDGKKRPISEIDPALLRKETGMGEAAPEGEPPAEGKPPAEGEAPVEGKAPGEAPAEGEAPGAPAAPAEGKAPAKAAGEGVTP